MSKHAWLMNVANARVLYPSAGAESPEVDDAFEIVYGSCTTRSPSPQKAWIAPVVRKVEMEWQYAVLVVRLPCGEYSPLLKGNAFNSSVPWSRVLRGLLDASAAAIHKRFGRMALGSVSTQADLRTVLMEEPPRYGSLGLSSTERSNRAASSEHSC